MEKELTDFQKEYLQIARLIEDIGSQKMLRIERYQKGDKDIDIFNRVWKVGIEWYTESQYEFLCENKSLLKCLLSVNQYLIDEGFKEIGGIKR